MSLAVGVGHAQSVSVVSKIDTMTILIGQQTRMTVDVTARKGAKVVFPHFKRTQYIVPGVEVLDDTKADTSDVDGMMRVSKTFTLTSFDERLYAIPGLNVKVDGKSYASNQLALKVITCDVDTLPPEHFYPPKDVQDNPFLWAEWSPLFWLSLLMLILCGCVLYLRNRLKNNKPIITRIRIVKRVPAHEKALSEINEIKQHHTVSQESQKKYYTQLTNTLREYIVNRFGFNAMEMTSGEIIDRLRQSGDQKMIDELKELFQTADLVKFAKYETHINENDANLVNAIHFIDQTKTDEKPVEEKIVPTLSAEDKKSQQQRQLTKLLLLAGSVAAALILGYVIFSAYMLVY